MKVLFFAFANSSESPLPTLQREADEIHRYLSERALEQHFLEDRELYATREKITFYLSRYRRDLVLFHYSGHAGRDRLFTPEEEARAEGIAHLLGQCPNLRLVVLNGCSTQGQVRMLLDKGVPAVIATSAPVDDERATRFAIRFYQSLANNDENLEQAFSAAEGDLLSQSGEAPAVQRGELAPAGDATAPLWGLFLRGQDPEVLRWMLPSQPIVTAPADYLPNELVIETLLPALKPYRREVRNIVRDEEEGEKVDLADKRLAILNSLPVPLAEQLRRLMVPLGDTQRSYDKVGRPRLEQLVRTAEVIVDLLVFTLMAEMWEAREQYAPTIDAGLQDQVRAMLLLPPEERSRYDFIPLIRNIYRMLNGESVPFHFEELGRLRGALEQEGAFQDAVYYLYSLKQRLARDDIQPHEVPGACQRAEKNLAILLGELGFLAKYTLAAVKDIAVFKHKYLRSVRFRHSVVKLIKLMGGLENQQEELEECLDSLSVLLLKEDAQGPTAYLNLSPFIIDKNAFEDNSDISQIYFFSHYNRQNRTFYFRNVNKPDDLLPVTSQAPYAVVPLEFEAFTRQVLNQSLESL